MEDRRRIVGSTANGHAAKNHPSVDGNKRTAIAATGIFLARNGRPLTATNEELERFTLQVAEGGPSPEDITAWLSSHSVED